MKKCTNNLTGRPSMPEPNFNRIDIEMSASDLDWFDDELQEPDDFEEWGDYYEF